MNESPITQLQGEHSEIMKGGKLGYKLQRYGAIFKELKNWPEYLAFKMGIHPGKDFVFKLKDGNIYRVPKKMIGPFRECFFDDQYMLHFDQKGFPKNPVIFDVGANVGYAALYFFRCFPHAAVHSFEPMPFLQQMMEKHKAEYPGHDWNQHPFGLWKEDGHMDIFTDAPDDFTSISGIAHFENAVHKVSIQVMALSTFINENKIDTIDLLKMDCEGAEYDILFNLPENYFSRIKRMAMETHETQQYTTVEMATFLMAKGYQVKYVTRPATRTGHVWAWK